MGDLNVVKQKVQSILADEFNSVTLFGSDGFSLQFGSARVFVEVEAAGDRDDAPIFVTLTAPLLRDVPATPELYEHVAWHCDDLRYGVLGLRRSDAEGKVNLTLGYGLLGDYLDRDELGFAVGLLGKCANDLDDELQTKFGGTRFHEDA